MAILKADKIVSVEIMRTPTGIILPTLTTPATAAEILSGKQAIDQDGQIITGTMPTGKKYATGTINWPSAWTSYTFAGLSFTPSFMLVTCEDTGTTLYGCYYYRKLSGGNIIQSTCGDNSTKITSVSQSSFVVSSSNFAGKTVQWTAVE